MRLALCTTLAASLIGAQAPPAGAVLVDKQQVASGPTLGTITSNKPIPALSGVKAGDLIVVLVNSASAINPSGVPTDSSSNTYTADYVDAQPTRGSEYVYHAVAAADAATLTVTLHNSSSFYGQIVAAAYRAPVGKTWSFDSANFSAHTNGFTTADISQTFNTSGPGVVGVIAHNGNYDNSATYGLVGTCTGAAIEEECPANSTAGVGYLGFTADHFALASLSSYTVSVNFYTTSPGDTTSNKDLVIAPFVYA